MALNAITRAALTGAIAADSFTFALETRRAQRGQPTTRRGDRLRVRRSCTLITCDRVERSQRSVVRLDSFAFKIHTSRYVVLPSTEVQRTMVRRDPDATRQRILEAAGEEIHRHGFRNASIDEILSDTGLTKGALYHHFPTKAALGHAVIDEVIRSWIVGRWVEPMERSYNPIDGLLGALNNLSADDVETVCECGCPLNNLAQEMSSVDETFRQKLASVYRSLTERMADALLRGQGAGVVSPDVNCRRAAVFLAATLAGAAGAAKNARDPEVLAACRDGLVRYLESLRAPVLATVLSE